MVRSAASFRANPSSNVASRRASRRQPWPSNEAAIVGAAAAGRCSSPAGRRHRRREQDREPVLRETSLEVAEEHVRELPERVAHVGPLEASEGRVPALDGRARGQQHQRAAHVVAHVANHGEDDLAGGVGQALSERGPHRRGRKAQLRTERNRSTVASTRCSRME